MKPPNKFRHRKDHGYSLCDGCRKWKLNNIFHHEGQTWILCEYDFYDYWENTDERKHDYVWYG